MVNPISSTGGAPISSFSSQGSAAVDLTRKALQAIERGQTPKENPQTPTTPVSSSVSLPPVRADEQVSGKSEAVELNRAVPSTQVAVEVNTTDRRGQSIEERQDIMADISERAIKRRQEKAQAQPKEREGYSDGQYGVEQRRDTKVSIERFVRSKDSQQGEAEERIENRSEQQQAIEAQQIEIEEKARLSRLKEEADASVDLLQDQRERFASVYSESDVREDRLDVVAERDAERQDETVERLQEYRALTEEISQDHRDEIFNRADSYSQQGAEDITGTYVDVSI